MNKIILSTVVACGLLLLDSPDAAAHEESYGQQRSYNSDRNGSYKRDKRGRQSYNRHGYRNDQYRGYRDRRHGYHHYSNVTRAKKMPKWLKRDRAFRHWYEHTRLRRNRLISWNQLFDIYLWESDYSRYRRY